MCSRMYNVLSVASQLRPPMNLVIHGFTLKPIFRCDLAARLHNSHCLSVNLKIAQLEFNIKINLWDFCYCFYNKKKSHDKMFMS